MSAFLGVQQSATGRCWVGLDAEQDRAAQALAQGSGLPEVLCRTLVRRGVAAQDVDGFLEPTLRDLMPDPSILKDMDKAAARFLAAVDAGEKIAVFGDYDVDGGASSALLFCVISHCYSPLVR